mmetsp:Transcript_31775/g.48772  ORF Transcript_31775/g.48772 Transcript_31775/m.48772 type:complete len:145 (+) Transcript_31775:654-1088(+)
MDYTHTNLDTFLKENERKWEIVLMPPFILHLGVGIYSCGVAWKSLAEPGIGQAVRNKVIHRQIQFVLITFGCNFPSVLWEIIEFWAATYNASLYNDFFVKYRSIDIFYLRPLQFSCGILTFIHTMRDPFFSFLTKQKLKKLCSF